MKQDRSVAHRRARRYRTNRQCFDALFRRDVVGGAHDLLASLSLGGFLAGHDTRRDAAQSEDA